MTQEELKAKLSYDKYTGLFHRGQTKRNHKRNPIAGSVINTGYIGIRISGKSYLAHRLAWLYEYGEFPTGDIDHINHNLADNSILNLREVSKSENSRNRKLSKDNSSGFNGVNFDKASSKWRVRITVDKKRIELGKFKELEDAISTRREANMKYGYHENHGKVF